MADDHVVRTIFQCQRAIVRSWLWDPDRRVDRATLPTAGDLQVETAAMGRDEAAEYDEVMDEYVARTLYAR